MDCHNSSPQHMCRRRNNGQISIAEFCLLFGGTLGPVNRSVKLEELMPWEELEEAYAPQINATNGAPDRTVVLTYDALYIKQRLGLADKEAVDQIRENPYMQFFLDFEGYTSKKPFAPSIMAHFRKCRARGAAWQAIAV